MADDLDATVRVSDWPVVPTPPERRPAPTTALSAGLVSLALVGVNSLAYIFTVVAAHALAPEAYGELAALVGIMFIGVVPATGLQMAAALKLGRGTYDPRRVIARVHGSALFSAAAVGVAGLIAAVPLVSLLHLSGPSPVLWLVAVLIPHTLVGGYDGILQGSGRYGRLAVVTGAFGILKSGGGVVGLIIGGTPTSGLAGMAIGCTAGAVLGWLACGRPGVSRDVRTTIRAAASASGTLLGLILLINLDVLLARHHLPAELAGEYAVAAIFAKIAFWLPQGVSVVLVPRLADPRARRRVLPTAVGLVAVLGALLTGATAILGVHALPLVGGEAYGAALGGATWVFTLVGALLAVAQLVLYGGIAAADRAATGAVWFAAVLEVVGVEVLAATGRLSVLSVAVMALTAGAVLVATGCLRTWQTHRQHAPAALAAGGRHRDPGPRRRPPPALRPVTGGPPPRSARS